MVFAYYSNLSRQQKAIYRRSDEIEALVLKSPSALKVLTKSLAAALESEDRGQVQRHAKKLTSTMLAGLDLDPVEVKVLSARPSKSWGELQGLYEGEEEGSRARITVWMRTARHKRVVAFKTFLRTLLHEICHHLDYELLELEDSFHTEGFFKRESSLFHQLMD